MNEAGRTHQALVDSALATRNELASWRSSVPHCRAVSTGAAACWRAWASAPTRPQLRAELSEVELRLKQLQKKLEGCEPRIEIRQDQSRFLGRGIPRAVWAII